MWELEAEVNNGGFIRFYSNSTGDRARETAAALRAIGADRGYPDDLSALLHEFVIANRCDIRGA